MSGGDPPASEPRADGVLAGRRVVLVSGHYALSKRRAGFHWLAEAYWRLGADVVFVTAALSWLSRLRRDHRFAYPVRAEANRVEAVKERFTSYVLFTRFHPANLRLSALNRAATPLFARYARTPLGELEALLDEAHVVVFESTAAILLLERFRELSPGARFVYRVSDDMRLLRLHPLVQDAERQLVPRFDLVSTPSPALEHRFAWSGNVRLHPHAIDKRAFDHALASPYERGQNAVYTGVSRHFDARAVVRAGELFPAWSFHVLGQRPLSRLTPPANVSFHGEVPFADTVAYVKHADIGLNTRAYAPGAESLTDSLKVVQYAYCGLPIVAPDFLRNDRRRVFVYRPGDDASLEQAFAGAAEAGRGEPAGDVLSWEDLARELAGP